MKCTMNCMDPTISNIISMRLNWTYKTLPFKSLGLYLFFVFFELLMVTKAEFMQLSETH